MRISKPYQPKHQTILPSTARYFVRRDYQLSWPGKILGQGAVVMLGPIITLYYDHQPKEAAPFIMDGREYYLLIEEIHLDGLREKLEVLAKRPRLAIITP